MSGRAEFDAMHKVIWQTETMDFGGYSHRDAAAVAMELWKAGYRKVDSDKDRTAA